MAYVINTIVRDWRKHLIDNIDVRTNQYFLLQSPQCLVGILVAYYAFVMKIGPQLMKNRKPFNLKTVIFAYNIIQILLNGSLFIHATVLLYQRNPSFTCWEIDYDTNPVTQQLIRAGYFYHLIKVVDLVDTIIFVLRKKQKQVSFLHVYHHILMVIATWLTFRYAPGGQGGLVAYINAIVHVIMYCYYFMSSWRPEYVTEQLKKAVTIVQLIQHFAVLTIVTIPLLTPSCSYPKLICYLSVPQALLMICLFGEFYYKSYIKKKTV